MRAGLSVAASMPTRTAPSSISATSSISPSPSTRGGCTCSTMSAPLSVAARPRATDAPAASKSPSEKRAPVPAPLSTTISTPRSTNLAAVSGDAATRRSWARRSRGTAIFIARPARAPARPPGRHAPTAWYRLPPALTWPRGCRCRGKLRGRLEKREGKDHQGDRDEDHGPLGQPRERIPHPLLLSNIRRHVSLRCRGRPRARWRAGDYIKRSWPINPARAGRARRVRRRQRGRVPRASR